MSDEAWKAIEGLDGFYEVSNLGRVRSKDRLVQRKDGRIRKVPGKILKTSNGTAGHRLISVGARPNRITAQVHRLVIFAFVGPEPFEGAEVRHLNGIPDDNRLENLKWGTRSENLRDMALHGTNYQLNKTECPRGHPLALPNLTPSALKRGQRTCLACQRAHSRIFDNPDAGLDFKAVADSYYQRIVNSKKVAS